MKKGPVFWLTVHYQSYLVSGYLVCCFVWNVDRRAGLIGHAATAADDTCQRAACRHHQTEPLIEIDWLEALQSSPLFVDIVCSLLVSFTVSDDLYTVFQKRNNLFDYIAQLLEIPTALNENFRQYSWGNAEFMYLIVCIIWWLFCCYWWCLECIVHQCFIQAHFFLGGGNPPQLRIPPRPPKNLRRGLLLCECNTCKLTECSKLTK